MCQGGPPRPVCGPPTLLAFWSILFSPLLFRRALQDVQIRFQPQLNPDVVAPLSTHTAHEDFSESGNRRERGSTDAALRPHSAAFPTAFGESRPELGSEGLASAAHGSQPDLRRIVELPAPADFLSLSSETKPKLMTPDAFMTPTASLQQVLLPPQRGVW